MHQGQIRRSFASARVYCPSFIKLSTMQMHIGTENPGLLHLGIRRRPRHDDAGGYAEALP